VPFGLLARLYHLSEPFDHGGILVREEGASAAVERIEHASFALLRSELINAVV
jgi:hypothetical protein